MHSQFDSKTDIDRMFNVENMLNIEEEASFPALGFETNLALYHLPDFDDLSSPVQEKEVPQVMFNPSDNSSKKSPWHESDSGMSETMSFAASPLGDDDVLDPQNDFLLSDLIDHTSNNEFSSLPLLDQLDGGSFPANDAEIDPVSENFLNPSNQQGTFSVLPHKKIRPVRKCATERKWDVMDVLSSDSDDESKSESRGSENVETNQIQDLTFFSGPNFPARSDIKILKVLKPTPGNVDASPDDIMKALDERSKKNAKQAKMNREKKKAYISSLESDIQKLKEENGTLVSENKQMKNDMFQLEEEVSYLKSVLANASSLSGLLKNLNNVKEVKLSATITGRKRGNEDDHTYNLVESRPAKRARMVKENLKKAGVCLHVSEGEACLEFCAHCASLARKSHGYKH